LLSVPGLVSTSVYAQVVTPPDAGSFIREIETESRLQPLTQEEELTLPEAAPDAAPVAPGGPAVLVDRFVVTGAEAIPTATLEALLTDLQGKALTLAELQEAAARVTRHYRDQGYFLTRAYL